jgi:hypothetical protein
MENEKTSAATGLGTFFNFIERVVLFALSASVGILNLLIGLAVAAHLGVIPKAAAGRVLHATSQATAFVTRIMAPSSGASPKHKAKP